MAAAAAALASNSATASPSSANPTSLTAVSTICVGAGQTISTNPQTAPIGVSAPLTVEPNKTSSVPAAQPTPASVAAESLSNALLSTTTLQAAHDVVFSGSSVDGLLGTEKATTSQLQTSVSNTSTKK